MTKKYLQTRLISLVKPDEMSNAEYILKCTIRGINPSVDDPQYMHWIINEAYNDFNAELHCKVRDLIIKGLKQHLILDFTKDEDNSYISELLPDLVLRGDKDEIGKFFRVILEEYRHTPIGEQTYSLNRAFGFTSYCYFKDGFDGFGGFSLDRDKKDPILNAVTSHID